MRKAIFLLSLTSIKTALSVHGDFPGNDQFSLLFCHLKLTSRQFSDKIISQCKETFNPCNYILRGHSMNLYFTHLNRAFFIFIVMPLALSTQIASCLERQQNLEDVLPEEILREITAFKLKPNASTPEEMFKYLDSLTLGRETLKAKLNTRLANFLKNNNIPFTEQNLVEQYKDFMTKLFELFQQRVDITELPQEILAEVAKFTINTDAAKPAEMFRTLDNLRQTSRKTKKAIDSHVEQFLTKNNIIFNPENAYSKYKDFLAQQILNNKDPYFCIKIYGREGVRMQLCLPLDAPYSQDDYLVFKPIGESLNSDYMFEVKHRNLINVTYNQLFRKFLSRKNWAIIIRSNIDDMGQAFDKNTFDMTYQGKEKGIENILCIHYRKDKPFWYTNTLKSPDSRINGYLKTEKFVISELDLSEILWIKKGQTPRTMDLKSILKEIENNPKYKDTTTTQE